LNVVRVEDFVVATHNFRKGDASISPDEKTLTARGFCIGRIDHVGRVHTSHQDNIIETLQTLHAWRKLI
jgi:hypothetical protein